MNQNTKNFLKSKAFWGAVLAIGGGLLKTFGIELGTEEAAAIAENLAIVAGGVLALIGRLTAKTKLTVTKKGE